MEDKQGKYSLALTFVFDWELWLAKDVNVVGMVE